MFKFKEVSEQEYNDCAKGIIKPETFHRNFFVLLGIFQVLDAPIPKWTYFAKAVTVFCALATLTILSLGLYHGIMICDIPFISEVGSYWIVIFYQFLVLVCTNLNVSDYHQLQRIMREDFLFACTKGEKYRKKFFYNQIFTRKICKFTMTFITGVSIGMMVLSIFSLLFFLATHEPGEGKRPLLFPLWVFSVDFGATPIYEIAFVYCCSCTSIAAINYILIPLWDNETRSETARRRWRTALMDRYSKTLLSPPEFNSTLISPLHGFKYKYPHSRQNDQKATY